MDQINCNKWLKKDRDKLEMELLIHKDLIDRKWLNLETNFIV